MTKIMQFGEGNFLRSFVDLYFETLNQEGGDYSVTVAQPHYIGSLEAFKKQNNKYNVILRGEREEVFSVNVLDDVFSPFDEEEKLWAVARDPELKLVVSNTTEAGIRFSDADSIDGFRDITFPAKLTKFLYKRFEAGLGGVYMLPVELIDHNADELYSCVDRYITLWSLPEEFREWNDRENVYCNTLVDRIVSGYPRDPELRAHLTELVGEEDLIMSIAEPFGLWAIEKKGDIDKYIREGVHNIEVVLTTDIDYYKKRKVRMLNGSHTNLVPAGIILGKETVFDCTEDEKLRSFMERALDEIIPFVSSDTAMTRKFAEDVIKRFENPHLNHRLSSIALNSISKWRARDLPSFTDYYNANGEIPKTLTVGFSYLMYLYMTRWSELSDDAAYLSYFEKGGSLEGFMSSIDIWGEDLTAYKGFFEAVSENIDRIRAGEILI